MIRLLLSSSYDIYPYLGVIETFPKKRGDQANSFKNCILHLKYFFFHIKSDIMSINNIHELVPTSIVPKILQAFLKPNIHIFLKMNLEIFEITNVHNLFNLILYKRFYYKKL